MILMQLLISFLQVGAFSVGGGYAAIPLIRSLAVDINGWLSLSEFTNLVTIAEMTPGPIAINAATFIGMRMAGVPGAVCATLGCVVPSLIIVSVLAGIYLRSKGGRAVKVVLATLRAAVVALIASAALSLMQAAMTMGTAFFVPGAVLFALAFAMLTIRRCSPILVIAGCGAAGALLHALGVM